MFFSHPSSSIHTVGIIAINSTKKQGADLGLRPAFINQAMIAFTTLLNFFLSFFTTL